MSKFSVTYGITLSAMVNASEISDGLKVSFLVIILVTIQQTSYLKGLEEEGALFQLAQIK